VIARWNTATECRGYTKKMRCIADCDLIFALQCSAHCATKNSMTRCFGICALLAFAALAEGQENAGVNESPAKRAADPDSMNKNQFGLVIHGGAGTIERSKLTPEKEQACRAALQLSLKTGFDVLKRGGSSLDAVEAAVRVLEDDPHFNAGKGAVFTSAGTNELDASIMDGRTLKVGAVVSLTHVRNPISLARLVMEKSPHVMLDCAGAEAFARENGVELVDQKYFFTQERWDALQLLKAAANGGGKGKKFIVSEQDKHGTVGAVAVDQSGNLAAATSTGGTTNKHPGRVGDSPIIGAGTYANNATCAISATGDGEYFIRATAAHDVSALMEYRGLRLAEAAQAVLDKVEKLGGTGGLIGIDAKGAMTLPFNTSGMYRGYVDAAGKFVVDIYR
jgi:beta-aspartyl-peptidase (threonine type)